MSPRKQISGVMDNTVYAIERSSNMLFQTLANAFASVDTFFVMSGCLVMLGTLRALDKFKGSNGNVVETSQN